MPTVDSPGPVGSPAKPEATQPSTPTVRPEPAQAARFRDALREPGRQADAKPGRPTQDGPGKDTKDAQDATRQEDGSGDNSLSALFRRREGRGGDGSGSGGEMPNDTVAAQARADALLQNLAQQSRGVDGRQAAQPPVPAEPRISDMVREVADRILVSDTGSAGHQEVRIILKDDVLGGTEIRVREHDGAVDITFVAGTKDAEQLLGTRQDEIRTSLGERLNREVRVEITDRDGGRDHAGGGQSRGQEQNEGRSRNRRSAYDERSDT